MKKRTPSRLPCRVSKKKSDLKYSIEGGRREERNKALHKRWGPGNVGKESFWESHKERKKEIVSRQFAPAGRVLIYSLSVSPSSLARAPCTQARGPFPNPCPPRGIAAAAHGVHSPRGPHQPRLNRETCHLGAHHPTWLQLWGLPYAERRASYAGFSPQPCSQTSWG